MAAGGQMQLSVMTPTAVLADGPALKVIAEGLDGFFCLLPRHIDLATALVPGLLLYVTGEGETRYLGIDSGTLVKEGARVSVAVRNAFPSDDLEGLAERVDREFRHLDEQERTARTALARLEAGALRRLLEAQR